MKRSQHAHRICTARYRHRDTRSHAQILAIESNSGNARDSCHVLILSSILLNMLKTRPATAADAPLITHHRRRMFVDAGRRDDQRLELMAQAHEPWVAQAITDGKYLGWLSEDDGKVIAGAGLLLLDWPPHPLDPQSSTRGYLLNVYVEPEYRRRRLATNLIELALAEARRRGIRVVALHSTEEGRRLYESAGFRTTNEMFYVESIEP
jgi:ribosomal protein S18 acetylase RimI-like enzyme